MNKKNILILGGLIILLSFTLILSLVYYYDQKVKREKAKITNSVDTSLLKETKDTIKSRFLRKLRTPSK